VSLEIVTARHSQTREGKRMNSIELTAKSVDDAKKNAAAKLGVSADQVTITVLEETKGLFGKVNLRVRAEVVATEAAPAAAPAAPAEEAPKAKAAPKAAAKKEEAPAAEASAPRRKLGAKKEAPAAPAAAEVATEEAAPAAAAKPARGKKPVKAEASEAPAAPEAPEEAAEGVEDAVEIVATTEDENFILTVANDLVAQSGLSAEFKASGIQGKYVNISLDGNDTKYLIGRNGEVINALQYLMNLAVKQQRPNGVRVVIDGNDYRKRREQALTALAQRIAAEVQQREEEAVLDALPAFERRVVHKALQEIPGVKTYSEGEEPNRRVVIAPAD